MIWIDGQGETAPVAWMGMRINIIYVRHDPKHHWQDLMPGCGNCPGSQLETSQQR